MKLKIEGYNDLIKDPITGAVININKSKMRSAAEAKENRLKDLREKEHLKRDVAALKDDISEIKNLLKELMETKHV